MHVSLLYLQSLFYSQQAIELSKRKDVMEKEMRIEKEQSLAAIPLTP